MADISIGAKYFAIRSACSIPVLVKGTPSVRPARIRLVLFSACACRRNIIIFQLALNSRIEIIITLLDPLHENWYNWRNWGNGKRFRT